jgi:predicted nucleotidyltransferase component of viral defense system
MPPILIHEDPDLFRSAVTYTAATTGFQARLIEKDYFCSVVLQYLGSANDELVFKGGTCLAKVLVGFYRLSEDLDFVVPMEINSTRAERRRHAEPLKEAVAKLPAELPVFRLETELAGANNSTQYQATVEYTSLLSGQSDTIKIEIGLREPLLAEKLQSSAKTLLLNPVSGVALVESVSLLSIAGLEAFAEKFRAALSRREVAIRDFYDLDHAVRKKLIDPHTAELVNLVRRKLEIPGNEAVDTSERRLTALRQQVEAQLRPVLREDDFNQFELDRAFGLVSDMAAHIAE